MRNNHISRLTLLMLATSLASCYDVTLKHLSTVYLPHSFSGDSAEYEFDTGAAVRAAFEPTGKIIYAIGETIIHIIDASDPMELTYVNHLTVDNRELTDVEVCGDAVFVTYLDLENPLQGGVLQYQLYSPESGTITYRRDIKIGSQPDMLTSTLDCTLVVALENPAVDVDGQFQDPPAGVGIIRFPQGVKNTPEVSTLDFTAFDSSFEKLAQTGVRWIYRENNNKFSNDIEPEYVTLNADQTKAFVGLQENNAIAVVDLVTSNITAIHGLGFKNWTEHTLDPSDVDGGIHLASWPLYGIYQPRGIQWFRWSGQNYIISGNEGAIKRYFFGGVDFDEYARGERFTDERISASVSPEIRAALQDETKLGRLQLSAIDGKDNAGKFEEFYTFGGRSFSIWSASDMAQVYDSGSTLSEKIVELRKDLFNTDIKDADENVAYRMDRRSDNKGSEPKSVAVARILGHLVLFIGIEKPGTIAVYGVAPGKSLKPRFKSLYTDGIPRGDRTWKEMYEARELHAIDPVCIEFIEQESGLADYPILLVTGYKSGTVSLLKVQMAGIDGGSSIIAGSPLTLLAAYLLAIINGV